MLNVCKLINFIIGCIFVAPLHYCWYCFIVLNWQHRDSTQPRTCRDASLHIQHSFPSFTAFTEKPLLGGFFFCSAPVQLYIAPCRGSRLYFQSSHCLPEGNVPIYDSSHVWSIASQFEGFSTTWGLFFITRLEIALRLWVLKFVGSPVDVSIQTEYFEGAFKMCFTV